MSVLIFFFFGKKKLLHHQMPGPDLDFRIGPPKKINHTGTITTGLCLGRGWHGPLQVAFLVVSSPMRQSGTHREQKD